MQSSLHVRNTMSGLPFTWYLWSLYFSFSFPTFFTFFFFFSSGCEPLNWLSEINLHLRKLGMQWSAWNLFLICTFAYIFKILSLGHILCWGSFNNPSQVLNVYPSTTYHKALWILFFLCTSKHIPPHGRVVHYLKDPFVDHYPPFE